MTTHTKNLLKRVYNEEIHDTFWLRKGGSDEQGYNDTFEGRYHLPEFENIGIPETIIDLGSNIGLTVAHYHYIWPQAKILGFEMDVENWFLSRKNTDQEILNTAINAYRGWGYYIPKGSEQAYKLLREPDVEAIPVKCATLDDAINLNCDEKGRVDFVKMDIEGAEFDILRLDGAWPYRIRNLLVECHGKDDDDTENKTEIIFRALKSRDFKVKRHKPHWSAIHAWKSF